MRTAEIIVKEYLERGYNLESLRVLAESRSEPLCSEMLAIIDTMRDRDEPRSDFAADDEAYGQSNSPHETTGSDDQLFFVADDEETASGDEGLDFDILAAVDPENRQDDPVMADTEDSVADIVIGYTDGAEVVSFAPPAQTLPEEAAASTAGIWSRIWRTNTPDGENPETVISSDGEASDASALIDMSTAPEERDAAPTAAETDVREEMLDTDLVLDSAATENADAEMPTASDSSGDYIPGSVIFQPVEAMADDAPVEHSEYALSAEEEDVAATQPECAEDEAEPESDSSDADADAELQDAAEDGQNDMHYPVLHSHGDKKTSRRERRRREKGTRKKRARKTVAEDSVLPEIILAKADGTDTMIPEAGAEHTVHDAGLAVESPADAVVADGPGSEIPDGMSEGETGEDRPLEDLFHLITSDTFLIVDESGNDAGEASTLDDGEGAAAMEATESLSLEMGEGEAKEPMQEAGEAAEEKDDNHVFNFDPGFHQPEADDHYMIIANGGIDSRELELSLFTGPAEEAEAPEEDDNILRFSDIAGEAANDDAEEEEYADGRQMLHLLPPLAAEESTESVASLSLLDEVEENTGSDVGADAGLSPMARLSLLRAYGGMPCVDATAEEAEALADREHVIVSLAGDESGAAEAQAADVQAAIEREYQERLDEFAARILEVQALAAESEARVREKAGEVTAREEELERIRELLDQEAEKQTELSRLLESAKEDSATKGRLLDTYQGIQDEHERLYREFEDLRRSYNEVVEQVMPELQEERDDLALTVERQNEECETLRGSLGSVRRRLAAGYSLAAAACLIMVALPVANWLGSGEQAKELAMDHQRMTEQRERLDKAERLNIDAEKTIHNLRREVEMARMEVAKLEERNAGLSRVADQHARELASARSALRNGNSSRTTDNLALQGGTQPSGALRTNEVRDPGGQIDRRVIANRNTRPNRGQENSQTREMAQGNSLRPPSANGGNRDRIPLNTVAREDPRSSVVAVAGTDTTTAKVRSGEGVAQVVYRVLGTRDPDVINWVIRENKIKRDRRGNPLIYKDQELRLPPNGRTGQAASAARR